MRIGYDLDISSSYVEREFTTYKLRCFYQRTNGNFSQHLKRKHPSVRCDIHSEKTFQLKGKAYASSDDNELSKIANSVPQNHLRTVKSEMNPTGIESEPELSRKENTIDEGCLPEGFSTMS